MLIAPKYNQCMVIFCFEASFHCLYIIGWIIAIICGILQLRTGGNIMTIDTNSMISITEANQNFSKVTRLVDEKGSAVILKNNVPRYLVIDFSKAEESIVADDDDVLSVSKRLMKKNKKAYEVLAKWKELNETIMAFADGSLDYDGLLKWVMEHQE